MSPAALWVATVGQDALGDKAVDRVPLLRLGVVVGTVAVGKEAGAVGPRPQREPERADLHRGPGPRTVPPGHGDLLVQWQPMAPFSTLMAYLHPDPVARQKEASSFPRSTRPDARYLDLNSSASSYRSRMRIGPAPSLPLSGGRPSLSFLSEGTIAPGCDSR